MTAPTIAQAVMTLVILIVFGGFLVWGVRTGQFRDIEKPKFRMLEDEDSPEDEEDD